MNHPLKFRFWFPKQKFMQYPPSHYENDGNNYYGNLCPYLMTLDGGPLKSDGLYFDGTWPLDDFPVILQFTGLTDKNGKEIYEGDILQHYGRNESTQLFSRLVLWDKQSACFINLIEATPIEIIGNIFETPDLVPQ